MNDTRTRLILKAMFPSVCAILVLGADGTGNYDFREKVLSNGLRVVTLEDFTCPIVAVQVWYHVGSKDEAPDRQGFAHMFEHMMFRGTDRLGPKDHFELIRKSGGDCNAYTNFDNTTYVNVVPSNQLPLVLWLEAERLSALKIDQGGFETERRVVEEERRLGLNQPYGSVPEKILPVLFTKHPYRWSVIGQIPHLRAATAGELQAFWDKFYIPSNAVLVIVGAVKHEEAQKLAEAYFGWLPRCPDPPRIVAPEPAQAAPRDITIEEQNGPVPLAGFAFRTVPLGHPHGPALEVLANILGEGDSSRLHRELVKKEKAAAFATAGAFQLEQAGFFGAGAALLPFGDPIKTLSLLEKQIQKLRDEDVTADELTKAKNTLLKSRVEARLTVESKAGLLGQAALIIGDTNDVNREVHRYRALTVADVRRVAKEYLTAERRTQVIVKPTLLGMIKSLFGGARGPPEDEGAAPPSAEAQAAPGAKPTGPKANAKRPVGLPEKPPLGPALETFPRVETVTRTLANGLKVVLVPNHVVPFVTIKLGILHGAASEEPSRPGAAAMACSMLTKGTAKHTADELAALLDTYAVSIGGFADHDSASIGASAVSDQFERAMGYLGEVTQSPLFPKEELETHRAQLKTSKLVAEKMPAYQANHEFDRVVFGKHPYARPADGTALDLDRLTPEDLALWWRTHARPDAAALYIAGDVEEAKALAAADASFGSWKSPEGKKPEATAPPFPVAETTRIYLIDRPGSYQSEIRVGHLGITRKHPEYSRGKVLDQVFGGSFTSRLNSTLRVKKGLTYGIHGGFSAFKDGGAFEISTFSKTPATTEALKTILEEIERLRAEAPTTEEMDGARRYLTGSFARERETPQATVNDLWLIESEGLPTDHLERFLKEAAATTSEDVTRIAREILHPDRLTIVVVGEAERIKADLEKIAPVTLVGRE